jgi:hypothetical protein
MKRWIIILSSIMIAIGILGYAAHHTIGPGRLAAFNTTFFQALKSGDAAALRSLTLEGEGEEVIRVLEGDQILKSGKIVTRGFGFTSKSFGSFDGYYDLSATKPDGSTVDFRVNTLKSSLFAPWRIRGVSMGTGN